MAFGNTVSQTLLACSTVNSILPFREANTMIFLLTIRAFNHINISCLKCYFGLPNLEY